MKKGAAKEIHARPAGTMAQRHGSESARTTLKQSRLEPGADPILVRNDCPLLQFTDASIQDLFLVLESMDNFDAPMGELSVVFLPEPIHTQLHVDYHDNPDPTDVITFHGDPATGTAGEICVSPEFATRYVEEYGGLFEEELTLYLVHGWLHLCGLDDHEEVDRKRMRAAEASCMQSLRERHAVPNFRTAPA